MKILIHIYGFLNDAKQINQLTQDSYELVNFIVHTYEHSDRKLFLIGPTKDRIDQINKDMPEYTELYDHLKKIALKDYFILNHVGKSRFAVPDLQFENKLTFKGGLQGDEQYIYNNILSDTYELQFDSIESFQENFEEVYKECERRKNLFN